MNADPDALRRAADEMDALIKEKAALRAGESRLNEGLRERAAKIHEVRVELRRAGYPVDECDWPTDALRQLVNAHIALKANPRSDAPITMALCSLLDDCRPAEIVDRVRGIVRKLEATESDRAGLVATTDTLRRERDAKSLTIQKCHTALTAAGVRQGTLDDRVAALIGDRAAKPTGPAWDDEYLTIDGARTFWTFELGAPKGVFGVGRVRDNKYVGYATSLDSARRLAELLAGFDPGGVWRVAGEPVTVAVVRAVCPTVAVSWGPS